MRTKTTSIDTPTVTSFCLPAYSEKQKIKLLHYAKQLLDIQNQMQQSNHLNILHHTLEHNDKHQRRRHYPKRDRIDHQHGGQYFYHCHRDSPASTEHGHFHCFVRQESIPKRLPRIQELPKPSNHPMTHLVAISMNQFGQPMRLFTVNRWVTDDVWYEAQYMPQLIKRFKITPNDASPWHLIDQWIAGMLALFTPQIYWLHQQRSVCYQDLNTEDKAVEELHSININLSEQIHWLIDD